MGCRRLKLIPGVIVREGRYTLDKWPVRTAHKYVEKVKETHK